MSEERIEITNKGVKLSYHRYLSDSATGFIIILLLIVAYYVHLPLPLLGESWTKSVPLIKSSEVMIFILLLLFFLATPIGLIINASSWFLIGGIQSGLFNVWLWLSRKKLFGFFIRPTIIANHFSKVEKTLLISNGKEITKGYLVYCNSKYLEEILKQNLPGFVSEIEHVLGIKRLIRSLSLIFFVSLLYLISLYRVFPLIIFCLIGFIVSLLLASLLEFYQCIKVLFKSYVLLRDQQFEEEPSIYKVGDLLASKLIKSQSKCY